MDIQALLQKLSKKVYLPMVFYIPYEALPHIDLTIKKQLEDLSIFNTLTIIKANEDVVYVEAHDISFEIFQKSDRLKSNLIELIELESNLQEESFVMLFENYLNTVNCYDFVYSWMASHVEKDISDLKPHLKQFFSYQQDVLSQHLVELKERFTLYDQQETNTLNLKTIFTASKELLPIPNELKATIAIPNSEHNSSKKSPNKRKKKIVLPSNEAVDQLLLKSLFKVNISNKN